MNVNKYLAWTDEWSKRVYYVSAAVGIVFGGLSFIAFTIWGSNYRVDISVLPKFVRNGQSYPIEVGEREIELKVMMKSTFDFGPKKFVHIFQREAGIGPYRYQSSTPFFTEQSSILKAWLGRESDINKSYMLFVTVDEKSRYPQGHEVEALPSKSLEQLELRRL
jgi:hypothetical protein